MKQAFPSTAGNLPGGTWLWVPVVYLTLSAHKRVEPGLATSGWMTLSKTCPCISDFLSVQ